MGEKGGRKVKYYTARAAHLHVDIFIPRKNVCKLELVARVAVIANNDCCVCVCVGGGGIVSFCICGMVKRNIFSPIATIVIEPVVICIANVG